MTDAALPAGGLARLARDAAAEARTRVRYRSERRFQFYGLFAIALTSMFLVAVLTDVLLKGLPAFTQFRLNLEVKVDPAQVDPNNSRDPAVIQAGDFHALVRDALRGIFPDATDRATRRRLDGLLSSGASDALRDRVIADLALIGQTVRVPVIVSADADLYFKSIGTGIEERAGRGIATPSATTGEIRITSTANDFSQDLIFVKRAISVRARDVRNEAERLQRSLRSVEARRAELDQSIAAARSANDAARVAAAENALKSVVSDQEGLTARIAELDKQAAELQARFDAPGADETLSEAQPSILVAINGGLVKINELGNMHIVGEALLPLSSTANAAPRAWRVLTYETPEANRRVGDREVAWLERLKEMGVVERVFNWRFFTAGDSREPELAGIRGALFGSALTLFVTLLICLPLGVAAAIYLEEFAVKNRVTELIEVNINNLAAVPSIVFGLLGLAVFLNFFGLPRSAPLVGGLVLALLVLPTIIIAARAALKAVPPSIKEAALGVGASHQQAVLHHVLPLAIPGILTGTIIGMAHALGETAPLLMIGMVAFIVEVPTGVTQAGTVLPVQIYLWSDLPEIGFQAKTAAAILVLLVFLFVMNGTAIYLRRHFERRW
jgi:phosphate transport system permease protein